MPTHVDSDSLVDDAVRIEVEHVVRTVRQLVATDASALLQAVRREVMEDLHAELGPRGRRRIVGIDRVRAHRRATDGLVLIGDAFALLDPVFSSGVFLALKSGEMAADAVNEALTGGDVTAQSFQKYGEDVCLAIERMRKIVYAFYRPEFNFGKLVKMNPELRPTLTDLLIGDIFVDKFDELFDAVREICDLPDELDYGHRVKSNEAVSVAG